jgi:hypothetical protein
VPSSNGYTISNSSMPMNQTSSNSSSNSSSSGSNSTGTVSSSNNTSSGVNSTSANNSTGGNSTSGNMIQCCDNYEAGSGYEFSTCEGVGALIRPELIGGARDIYWATQPPVDLLAPVWADLGHLLNNYCD